MSMINYASREINCKIVYYGPGRSGKTTNLHYVYGQVPDDRKGKMVSLATQTDRTLFFDFLPLDLGIISGFTTKFQLYTVPGQSYYNATRKLVLQDKVFAMLTSTTWSRAGSTAPCATGVSSNSDRSGPRPRARPAPPPRSSMRPPT
jgi:GTPase SAR1 family protein